MTQPLPWAPTTLEEFINCGRAYYGKRVAKTLKEVETRQQIWGKYVHDAFENRQGTLVPLPDDLMMHEPFMQKLWDKPGDHFVELQYGFNKRAQPCHFFDKDVWSRGKIDYLKTNRDLGQAVIVDYKTGKPHTKFKQLYIYCLWTFASFPFVNLINAQYYWTTLQDVTKTVVNRDDIPRMWAEFIPDLKQYAEAFKTDTWQERPSGLCHGWCPDTACQHWRPKRI